MTTLELDGVARDLRYAARALLRNPLFTIVALVTLVIGTGATIAVFSVVNSVLLNPLPYPAADRLVAIWHDAPGGEGIAAGQLSTSASMYFTYADENRTSDSVGVYRAGSTSVTGLAEPEQVAVILTAVAALASWLPARRASAVEPAEALAAE